MMTLRVSGALAVLGLLWVSPALATTRYLNNTGSHAGSSARCNDANSGVDPLQPVCTPSAMDSKTANGDTVLITPSFYQYQAEFEETSTGTTWTCAGADSPDDCQFFFGESTSSLGLTITATRGRTNIYQFALSRLTFGLMERGVAHDLNRRHPASDVTNGYASGSDGYMAWHIVNRPSDYFPKPKGSGNVRGTTVTTTKSIPDLRLLGSWLVGNKIWINGVQSTIASITDATHLELTAPHAGATGATLTIELHDTACPAEGTDCNPPTIDDCLDIVENYEGGWCQDTSTFTVYFHPRGNRNGTALTMYVGMPNNTPTAHLARDGTTVTNVTFLAAGQGVQGDGSARTNTGHALSWGGDGSRFSGIWTVGRANFVNVSNGGCDDLIYEKFLALYGMDSGVTAITCAGGPIVQDGELLGSPTSFNWSGPYSSESGNPTTFRRIIFHDSEVRPQFEFRNDTGAGSTPGYKYNPRTGAFASWTNEANGLWSSYFALHLVEWENGQNLLITQNVVYCFRDTIRVLNNVANVRILNNVNFCGWEFGSGALQSDDGSTFLYNNVVWGDADPYLNLSSNAREIGGSGNNLYLSYGASCGGTFCLGNFFRGSEFNLAQLRAVCRVCEVGSSVIALTFAALDALFEDPSVRTNNRGGDDYRQETGSALIDAGDDKQCGYVPKDGQCDIGAYEDSDATVGPQLAAAPRMWGETITIGDGGRKAGQPAPR